MKTTLTIILGLACLVGGLTAKEPFDYHSVRAKQTIAADITSKQEGEALPLKGKSRVQGMQNFGPQWSGDSHLLWNGIAGEAMETSFEVSKTGRHRFTAVLTLAPDYGIFTVRLNGKVIREGVDLYARGVELAQPLDLGEFDFPVLYDRLNNLRVEDSSERTDDQVDSIAPAPIDPAFLITLFLP